MSKKIKIAIIGSRGYPYVYSGYETLVKELSEGMIERGYDVTVYCHKALFKNKPKKINGINLIYMPSLQSKIFSQLYNSFFSFIHVCFSEIDVVLVVNSANGPFGILTKIFRKKTCINVDGMEWLRPKWKGIGSVYFRIASKLATILYDEIITDSKEMYKIYNKFYNKKSKVIAYGSRMIQTDEKVILNKFKLEPNDYFLVVGRLIPDNNSDLIVKGYLKSNSKKKLVIVGDVPYSDKYSNYIKEFKSKNIIFTGYVKREKYLNQLYSNCFAYIHGHEYGGTNPTMINALKLNSKIIALDTIFNREMTEEKSVLFFKKDFKSVSNSINELENKYNNYSDSNYLLPQRYDWKFIIEQYESLINKVTKF